jgi:hypothetical protein
MGQDKDRYIYMLFSNATPGAEEEYNDWYTNTHLDDVLAVPGFVAAQRFVITDARRQEGDPEPEHKYLAVYEIEGDVEAAFGALAASRPNMYVSPAMARGGKTVVFKAISDRRTAAE